MEQTFERTAEATLVLHLSSGEQIETTEEHPFYVEGRGFVAARELGIGTSIVTRAGPSVRVLSVERKSTPVKVYNFEVEDYHTYFVGNSQAWVHNQCIWTPNVKKGWNNVRNAYEHFKKHTGDFPGIPNAKQYVDETTNFINSPPPGTRIKQRLSNRDQVLFNETTDTFAVATKDGVPRTMFKPDPAKHGYPTNLDYFNAQ